VTKEDEDKTTVKEEIQELEMKAKSLRERQVDSEKKKARVATQVDLLEKYSKGLLDAGQKANTSDLLDIKTIGKNCVRRQSNCVGAVVVVVVVVVVVIC